jgi:hypothetical protein
VSGTAKPYTTRVLIRRPADPNKFSGTVQIEPLGDRSERAVNWEWTWPYLVAHGDVWAGVTVSQDDAANMLRKFDPARYADVAIPDGTMRGDMLAQAAWLLRSPDGPLAKLHFDDRAAIVAGLFQVDLSGWGATGCSVRDFIEAGNPARARTPEGRPVINGYLVGACPGPEPLHPPADAAVIQLASESAYRSPQTAAARQADIDLPRGRYRWYDVAGAGDWSYLDQPQFSIAFFQMGWTSKGPTCAAASDRLPGMRYFARAILADLDRWQRVGGHSPAGAVFDLDGDRRIKRDDNGDALGGVRAFWVDVPRSAIAAKTNDGCDGYVSEKQFPREQSEKLYKDQADYVNKLTDNLIKLVNGNYLLAADADAVIARAKSQ